MRASAWLAAISSLCLAACGGGGSVPPPPANGDLGYSNLACQEAAFRLQQQGTNPFQSIGGGSSGQQSGQTRVVLALPVQDTYYGEALADIPTLPSDALAIVVGNTNSTNNPAPQPISGVTGTPTIAAAWAWTYQTSAGTLPLESIPNITVCPTNYYNIVPSWIELFDNSTLQATLTIGVGGGAVDTFATYFPPTIAQYTVNTKDTYTAELLVPQGSPVLPTVAVSPNPMALAAGATATAGIRELSGSYTGPFALAYPSGSAPPHCASNGTVIADVTESPKTPTLSVTARAAGTCSITVSGTGVPATFTINVSGGGTPSPSPSPVPTATPTPAPTPGVLTILPATVSVTTASGAGPISAQTVVSESSYTGTFTANDITCSGPGYATISPVSANGPSATFTVNGGHAAGSCIITFIDDHGGSVSLNVNVAP